jgi:hypothetical protein
MQFLIEGSFGWHVFVATWIGSKIRIDVRDNGTNILISFYGTCPKLFTLAEKYKGHCGEDPPSPLTVAPTRIKIRPCFHRAFLENWKAVTSRKYGERLRKGLETVRDARTEQSYCHAACSLIKLALKVLDLLSQFSQHNFALRKNGTVNVMMIFIEKMRTLYASAYLWSISCKFTSPINKHTPVICFVVLIDVLQFLLLKQRFITVCGFRRIHRNHKDFYSCILHWFWTGGLPFFNIVSSYISCKNGRIPTQ